jgi:glycosyltransferase involved in cell wall biosynthesis
MSSKVSIIVPAFNESGNVRLLVHRLQEMLRAHSYQYEIIFINDGSKDQTQQVLEELHKEDSRVHFIELSRNFGHQNALKAGLDMATGDCVISMDSDLQHPPELIPQLIHKWEEGFDIVYTIREDSKKLTRFKRYSSSSFYRLVNFMSDINIEAGTADFRLIDRKVANVFSNFKENDPFIRGLIKWLGFKQFAIEYQPAERHLGESQYTLKKMLRFAVQGITSFSIRPLYTAIYLGFAFSLLSLLYIPYIIYTLYYGLEVQGWASVIMTVVFFGGLQLIILGIIGIYIGKLFIQSKQRPIYVIRNTSLTQS